MLVEWDARFVGDVPGSDGLSYCRGGRNISEVAGVNQGVDSYHSPS